MPMKSKPPEPTYNEWCKFDATKHGDPSVPIEHEVYICPDFCTLVCVHHGGHTSLVMVCSCCHKELRLDVDKGPVGAPSNG